MIGIIKYIARLIHQTGNTYDKFKILSYVTYLVFLFLPKTINISSEAPHAIFIANRIPAKSSDVCGEITSITTGGSTISIGFLGFLSFGSSISP